METCSDTEVTIEILFPLQFPGTLPIGIVRQKNAVTLQRLYSQLRFAD